MQLSPPSGRHADEIARRAHARALDAAHKLILNPNPNPNPSPSPNTNTNTNPDPNQAHKLILKRVLCTILLLDAAKEVRLLPSDP